MTKGYILLAVLLVALVLSQCVFACDIVTIVKPDGSITNCTICGSVVNCL